MASQSDVKDRIASVKNIQKITRAMEMVAAARLRRAEQRTRELRSYAGAIRRMTREASEAADSLPDLPILNEREDTKKVAIVILTGDRGLAGAFNSQIIRAAVRREAELKSDGKDVVFYAVGRRGASSLRFRGKEVADDFTGFTDRPSYADARSVADAVVSAYADGDVDRVDVFYNAFVSAISQEVTLETLLPLQQASILEEDEEGEGESEEDRKPQGLVEYEPDPAEILERLVPAYVEVSLFRAMLESSASEHGARMSAMRNASQNAGDLIKDLTLEMNRVRQAEITQEIMEVVSGAESLV